MKNITILGGGVLGSQIAYQASYMGFNVAIINASCVRINVSIPKFYYR